MPDIIRRRARVFVQQHGDNSELLAAQQLDLMLEREDAEGVALWSRIIEAIADLRLNGAPLDSGDH